MNVVIAVSTPQGDLPTTFTIEEKTQAAAGTAPEPKPTAPSGVRQDQAGQEGDQSQESRRHRATGGRCRAEDILEVQIVAVIDFLAAAVQVAQHGPANCNGCMAERTSAGR